MVDKILPILQEYKLDKPETEVEIDVLEYANSTANASDDEILEFYREFTTTEINKENTITKTYTK